MIPDPRAGVDRDTSGATAGDSARGGREETGGCCAGSVAFFFLLREGCARGACCNAMALAGAGYAHVARRLGAVCRR